jgi:hypothetical protein
MTFSSFQRRFHLDESARRRRGARRAGKRGPGPGASRHQHGVGGMPVDRRHRRHRRPRHRPDQLPRREAADAFERRLPRRPGVNVMKPFFVVTAAADNKLDRLALEGLLSLV